MVGSTRVKKLLRTYPVTVGHGQGPGDGKGSGGLLLTVTQTALLRGMMGGGRVMCAGTSRIGAGAATSRLLVEGLGALGRGVGGGERMVGA